MSRLLVEGKIPTFCCMEGLKAICACTSAAAYYKISNIHMVLKRLPAIKMQD